ncbi:hypothetical protein FA13DRAFT_1720572 [Coprinellus micaceus]|uniref:Uncharacterized protein n=1 Tax=Coprinellus micaceus TaxID=71717 RepID=A0A4Y7S7R7_COPMI|nr:hypothetical protein FA13DRAFT_1720572 [Coprinellus micaceus]
MYHCHHLSVPPLPPNLHPAKDGNICPGLSCNGEDNWPTKGAPRSYAVRSSSEIALTRKGGAWWGTILDSWLVPRCTLASHETREDLDLSSNLAPIEKDYLNSSRIPVGTHSKPSHVWLYCTQHIKPEFEGSQFCSNPGIAAESVENWGIMNWGSPNPDYIQPFESDWW